LGIISFPFLQIAVAGWITEGPFKVANATPVIRKALDWSPQSDKGFIYFDERLLESAEDLGKAFTLRFQVYCEEMGFLPACDYPHGIETDAYDKQSLHFGSFNKEDAIVGTVRLVRGDGIDAVPMHERCQLHAHERKRLETITDLVEVSRLAVSRNYRRRTGDGLYGLSGMPGRCGPEGGDTFERREVAFPTVLRLYRVMYHSLKRNGLRHILASMETTLFRILRSLRFPFREIGPQVDYYGPVRPFYLDLDELDTRLVDGHPDLLQYFNYGLPPSLQSLALPLKAKLQLAPQALNLRSPLDQ
jgi:N-acyl amino acid synthase of PEP-CTERM/exosortase system